MKNRIPVDVEVAQKHKDIAEKFAQEIDAKEMIVFCTRKLKNHDVGEIIMVGDDEERLISLLIGGIEQLDGMIEETQKNGS